MDAIDDRSIPKGAAIVPPELDPDAADVDREDPDSAESEPAGWPAWTDAHRDTPDRRGGVR